MSGSEPSSAFPPLARTLQRLRSMILGPSEGEVHYLTTITNSVMSALGHATFMGLNQ